MDCLIIYMKIQGLMTHSKRSENRRFNCFYIIDKILSSPTLSDKNFTQCIDVAYIGVITLMIKKLQTTNKEWKVHTFEPFKETF